METKLVRIAEISATSKHPIFTSVYHLINEDMLKQCHKELDGNKAVGIDKVTKDEYGKNLDRNIKELVQRLKNKSFKPLPSLRVYIPKGNGKKRPLGIASYEDKIVQMAVKKILGAIYEPRFLNCMYGFRPNRGCHEAIKEVYQRISYGKISYIVDADIKGFFDHIDHDWMMKFLEWNIQDKNLLWLIRKYLKAGIMEQGKFEPTEEGSAQGSAMSPMLANIYMHHVLTLWFKLVVQREMQGECFLVNFADDFVAGFQYKSEAERYYKELKERMEKFGLELESSKSRLIEFGRFAEQNRRARGECKPETFDFLGFTFYCSKTRKGGFVPKVQTSRKKLEQKVRAYKNWIYDNRNRPMREIIKELNVKLIGHYRYYGVTWNFRKITTFLHRVQQFLFKANNKNIPSTYRKKTMRSIMSSLSLQWATGKALCEILNNSRYEGDDGADNIDSTIELLQNTISYNLPLLLKPLYDMKQSESPFLKCMQVGAFGVVERCMIEMGVPRESALYLYKEIFDEKEIKVKNRLELEQIIREKIRLEYKNIPYWIQVQLDFLI